jgi:hypothetical protein
MTSVMLDGDVTSIALIIGSTTPYDGSSLDLD